eukprot:TRINITY_DN5935_c0_g1_i1.p1 TRINITY_DN5935_c0_g1~~TRINITY_DN5935_c0_g1_i1.p1  ORF type:complete len:223 (+),score=68.14 TRINITY_DN5935_c0_g1_i1:21-689(+)
MSSRKGKKSDESKDAEEFQYLIVLDFEATCEKDQKIPNPEIIEFPMVVVDVGAQQLVEDVWIQVYVKPVENPVLSAFCTELTGITQEVVDQAVEFPQAYEQVIQFLTEHGFINCAEPKSFAFVTCGHWDLSSALPKQARSSGMKVHKAFSRWINVKDEFERFYGRKGHGMKHLLETLNLELTGRHHSGIDDCRNIAKIVIKMLQDGCSFQINGTNHKKSLYQ